MGTVTVNGQVFDEPAVNYWLGGVILREMADSSLYPLQARDMKEEAALHIYVWLADRNTWPREDCGDEKWAWFEAGFKHDVTLPVSPWWLQAVLPGKPNDANDKPIAWKWGELDGKD
jgi:hypothetical protein